MPWWLRSAGSMPDNVIIDGDVRPVFEDMAHRIMAGQTGEDVYCLTVSEWPRVPDWLRRADGESVYRAPGSEVYATGAQLSAEEQMIARAQSRGAPRLAPDEAARLPRRIGGRPGGTAAGGDGGGCGGPDRVRTASRSGRGGFNALTSDRRAELIIAGAGTGKTTTAGQLARAWTEGGMGRVYGLALSSSARNKLAAADPSINGLNLAQALGHLPGQREARGSVSLGENAMILVDEATMAGGPDADAVLRMAERENAKLVLIGDIYQLSSPEQGGAFEMFARKLGYAQLQEPVRFSDQWQREASAQLRRGDRGGTGCLRRSRCAPGRRVRKHGRSSDPRVPARFLRGPGRADDCADERGDARPVAQSTRLFAALGDGRRWRGGGSPSGR